MKRIMLALAFTSLIALTGCNGFHLFGQGGLADMWTVSYVEVKPGHPTITVGATQQFRLVAYFADFHDEDKTGVTQWSSSNPAVATVNNVGLAMALSPGTTKIKGIYKDHSDDTTLTVVAAPTTVQNLSASTRALIFTLADTGREYGYVLNNSAGRLAVFANRGGDSFEQITEVALDLKGRPRSMALHPSGRWLYVGGSDPAEIVVFHIDPLTGVLTATEDSPLPVTVTPLKLSVDFDRIIVSDLQTKLTLICSWGWSDQRFHGTGCGIE